MIRDGSKEKEFLEKIRHVKTFRYSYSGFFHPSPDVILSFSNNSFFIKLDYKNSLSGVMYDENIDNTSKKYKKEEFIEKLEEAKFYEWKKTYSNKDILDGYAYEIEIEYDNGLKNDLYYGVNKCHSKFKVLKDYINGLIKELN